MTRIINGYKNRVQWKSILSKKGAFRFVLKGKSPMLFLCVSGVDTYLCCHFSVVDPSQSGKVGGFGAVEAVVEASVVTVGKCDHELSSFLGDLGNNKEEIPHRSVDVAA